MIDPASTLARPIAQLVHAPAIVCAPDTSIRKAAEMMTETGQTAVVVRLGGRLGILTDRDIRARVVAGGMSTDSPVSAVMSTPARSIACDRLCGEVVVEMLDKYIHHLLVTSPDGALLGMVEGNDLLALDAHSPFHMRTAIAEAATLDDCIAAAARLRPTVIALHDGRLHASYIAQVTSILITTLTCRLVDRAVAEHGGKPTEFVWLALGSLARNEAMPSSDIDCAIAWEGCDTDPELQAWMRGVAADVIADLEECGFRRDTRNALASHPLFSRSIGAWRETARSLIDDPSQENALILASVLVEARPIWGIRTAAPTASLFTSTQAHPALLRSLARLALGYRPSLGFRGHIAVQRSGTEKGKLDIKRGALIPIIDLARYAGMAAGTAAGSTRDRLSAAGSAGTLDAEDARSLEEAFDLLFGLRLSHQVGQIRSGQEPDNFIDPKNLDGLTRDLLKDALRAIARAQHNLGGELDLRIR